MIGYGQNEAIPNLPHRLGAAFLTAVCAPAQAQTVEDPTAARLKGKVVPSHEPPMPFLPGAGASKLVQSIEFRSVEQMSRQDRDLAVGAESAIADSAGFAGMEFNQGQWSYSQMVCPALPNHLLLRFTRNGGTGDISLFSASIPRGGAGRVRIIPIQRRGYSLFSPAPISALTISTFNRIRAEEPSGSTPDWLATGLCYAALAGAHPQLTHIAENPEGQKFLVAMPARLEIPSDGGAIIRFADVATPSRPMEWTMTFSGKGKLLKATHSPALLATQSSVVPASAVESQGRPIQAAETYQQGKPISPDSGPPKSRPIPGPAPTQPTPEQ